MPEFNFTAEKTDLEMYLEEKQALDWCYFERRTLTPFAYKECIQELNEKYPGVISKLLPVPLNRFGFNTE